MALLKLMALRALAAGEANVQRNQLPAELQAKAQLLLNMVSVTRLQLLRLEKQQARTSPECEAATLLAAEGLQHHCQDLQEQVTKLWVHQHLCQVEFNYNNEG